METHGSLATDGGVAAVASVVGDLAPLQALPQGPLGQLLVALVILAVVVLVGRFVLAVAWKLVLIAAVVVGALYLLSLVAI